MGLKIEIGIIKVEDSVCLDGLWGVFE